jgi:hypothetical protein
MNEAMRIAWLEISQMLGEPTREELDVFLRTWQRAIHAERERSKHNEEVLMNALWKACGDDEQRVKATIESQGELK